METCTKKEKPSEVFTKLVKDGTFFDNAALISREHSRWKLADVGSDDGVQRDCCPVIHI